MGLQNIFSTPIFTEKLNSKLTTQLEELIVPRLKLLYKNHEHFTDYNLRDKIVNPEEINEFLSTIDYLAGLYSHQSNVFKPNKINYWIQDYHKSHSHAIHAHGDACISGVFYLRANKNAGELRLHNPNPFYSITRLNNMDPNPMHYQIKPFKGLLVLFPGWLSHEVISSNNDNCVRTVIAFNFERY